MFTTTLQITGMHCASCQALIEDVAKDFAGVESAQVDLTSGLAIINHAPSTDLKALISEIKSLDSAYQVEIL